MKITAAHHSGRVSESESSDYEISSSSNDSLLTDEGKLSLKPYMHEPPATPSTLQKSVEKKKDQSQNPHTTGMLFVSATQPCTIHVLTIIYLKLHTF